MLSEQMRKGCLVKLYTHTMDQLQDATIEAEESKADPIDPELVTTHSFFMGLISGIILEKCNKNVIKPLEITKKAQSYVN